MQDIILQKRVLRKKMVELRIQLSDEIKKEYDNWICSKLKAIVTNNGFEVVHCYIPMRGEINILPFIKFLLKHQIKVVSPKTLPNRKLENRVLGSLDDLEIGIMGTMHPKKSELYLGNLDLIVVPGLAFDTENYRLGYGGGYYDNFLMNQPNSMKIGIFYPFQQVEMVPKEPHDVKLDQIFINDTFVK